MGKKLDAFIKNHSYSCWCESNTYDVFCSQLFGRNPFVVLKCLECTTQRILPRALDSQLDADRLYNSYHPPHVSSADLIKSADKCIQRILNTGISLTRNMKVLDVGCGNGRILESICKRFGCEGIGIDADARRIADAKAHAKHASFIVGVLETQEFDEDFDLIISSAVIEHVFDPVFFIRQLSRPLKSNGSLFLLTPNAKSLNYRILKSWWRELLSIGEHIYLFTPSSLELCSKKCGLSLAGLYTDFDFSHPSVRLRSCRQITISLWSIYRETCKRLCSILSTKLSGDILSVHLRKK